MNDSHASGEAHAVPHQSFAALRHPGFRAYFITTALSMMADSVEHVISYWMMFEKFHSPALGGFAVLSHWLPFLLFSVYSGALADRFDPRGLIQLGMLIFMAVSLGWGLLFLADSLEMWHAVVLLILHGFAGVLWTPAGQVLIHDIVGGAQLQSAVRLSATARWLGLLMGPAVGGGILLLLGPAHGILLNVLIYLPLVLWLWRAPYGPRFRKGEPAPVRAVRGLADIVSTMRAIAGNRTIVSMIVLSGLAALIVGNAYQAQMPEFAHDLGHGDAGFFYSMLLAADAAGAFMAGMVLESRGLLPPRPRTALVLAMLWCCALGGFAAAGAYPLALALLFAAGFLELSFNAMAQTLVQLNAPPDIRGRVIGLFTMASYGLRAFSGVTVGIGGSLIGIHWSLAISTMVLLAVTVSLLAFTLRGARAAERR
ncbi:MAG: MFS transporter [Betaproteobacteria bacterium]|nr:MFS transporter [Betaproteobacteria bacterium]